MNTNLLRLLEAEGVSSGATLSVLGVSAHPECPGVSLSVLGVSSQRFLLDEVVTLSWPGVMWPGVASHMRVDWPGVAPGVCPT